MLLSEILLFGLIGTMTALVIDTILTDGKKYMLSFFLILEGAFFGWLSGIMWVYLTGGMNLNIWAFLLPMTVSGILAFITVWYMPKGIMGRISHVSNSNVAIIVLISVIVIGAGIFALTPNAKLSAMSTETFNVENLQWQPGGTTLTASDVQLFVRGSSNPSMINISYQLGSINGLKVDNPTSNGYLNFKVTMHANALWQKPYIKISVYKDKNGNGKIDTGDIMWSDSAYKLSLTSADGDWRSNCVWSDNKPVSSAFVTQNLVLPIFDATAISPWQNEKGKVFLNTPEGYVPQNDMMSWELTSTGITLKENVQAYTSVGAGDQTSINGRIYCGQATGNNLILVQAYDASTTDPFQQNVDPIASQVIPFQVASLQGGIGNEWIVLGGLGIIVLIGVAMISSRKY
jgi:hypothetical protein